MTTEAYNAAISLLKTNDRLNKRRFPQPHERIMELEKELSVNLPYSYVAMLQEFGILLYRGGEVIYGIGLDGVNGKGGSGVLFQTQLARDRKQITPTMVRVMTSGYGPEFCIECSETNSEGEAPVYLVPADGDPEKTEKVADSFGEFLLAEVKLNLEG